MRVKGFRDESLGCLGGAQAQDLQPGDCANRLWTEDLLHHPIYFGCLIALYWGSEVGQDVLHTQEFSISTVLLNTSKRLVVSQQYGVK